MMFVRLTHAVLKQLRNKGFNVLTAVNEAHDANPSWMPDTVEDVWTFVDEIDEEKPFMVIENALAHIKEDELKGQVFVPSVL